MKFMVLMIPGLYRGNKKIDPNWIKLEEMEKMGKFNDELEKAGLFMKDANGLQPLYKGARISFDTGKPVVTDGPFVEVKEVLGGYWMLEAKSKEEVINWMKKCPAKKDDILEIRQFHDIADFPADVQKAFQEETAKGKGGRR